MSGKELDITISAYLKSIIESGAEPVDWETKLVFALKVHRKIKTAIQNQNKEND